MRLFFFAAKLMAGIVELDESSITKHHEGVAHKHGKDADRSGVLIAVEGHDPVYVFNYFSDKHLLCCLHDF